MLTSPAKSLKGSLQLPPDKSISQRIALFSLLSEQPTTVKNYSIAADPQSALACVESLGAKVSRDEKDPSSLQIIGLGREALKAIQKAAPLDCGNSGTAMRLLSGIVAGAAIETTLHGDASLSSRTMKRILDPLRAMGAKVEAKDNDFAPLKLMQHNGLQGINYALPVPSAQLKSCLLLAGLFADTPTTISESKISRDHTERMLQLPIHTAQHEGEIHFIEVSSATPIPNLSGTVPADFSAAAFWLVAGSIHPNAEIRLSKVGMNPTRNAALKVLQRMGAQIEVIEDYEASAKGEPLADLVVRSAELQSTQIFEEEMAILIDEIPVLAVAMACAKGRSFIRGAEELRHKETDRIAAVSEMLTKAGAPHDVFEDGLEISGDPNFSFKTAQFQSYHDHRIAMSSAVLSLRAKEACEVVGGDCATISYPHFWNDLAALSTS